MYIVNINGEKCSVSFDFCDIPNENIEKWCNFQAKSLDTEKFYELQVTKYRNDDNYNFYIEVFKKIENEDYEGSWIKLEEFINNSQELEKIKEILITLSDELN